MLCRNSWCARALKNWEMSLQQESWTMLCVYAVFRKRSLTKRAQSVPNGNRNHNRHLRKSASRVPNTALNDANLTLMAFVIFLYVCVYETAWLYMHHMCAGAHKGQRALDSLELELQEAMSHQMWLLRTEPRFSARAVSSLNCWAIFSVPEWCRYFKSTQTLCFCGRNHTYPYLTGQASVEYLAQNNKVARLRICIWIWISLKSLG